VTGIEMQDIFTTIEEDLIKIWLDWSKH